MTEEEKIIANPTEIDIPDRQSLVHLGSLDSFDITEGGREAAKLMLKYIRTGKKGYLRKAVSIYEKLIPNENFGGEYTALSWMCKTFLADEAQREELMRVPLVHSFFTVLTENKFDNLKTYLQYKYHIKEYPKDKDNTEMKARIRYLEDFILFNNPDRERWETTRENMEKLELKEGMRVADVGCGPGYFTFKFADLVGETGHVYATETNPAHLDFLRGYVDQYQIQNVSILESSFEGIGLSPDIVVDVVYICSLYHNIYAAFTDAERDAFVGSIRHALREGGRLIIVDNDLVTESNLPYHGPYINKKLIISQLYYYGFRISGIYQFTPQRYVLVFDKTEIPAPAEHTPRELGSVDFKVETAASLVRYRIIGTSTSGYTCRGKVWGRRMYEGLTEKNRDKVREARDGFNELWPQERIGDDYTALAWLCDYCLASREAREEMRKDPLTDAYARFFCGKDAENLKTYLYYKFDLAKPDDPEASIDTNFDYSGGEFSVQTLNKWNEYLIFNNPNRNTWEHTWDMLKFFDIREGEYVADIGCGGGFFTWQFSKAVGPDGKVFATEINKGALSYLESFTDTYGITNIQPMVTKMNETGLPDESVDVIFMCSMYHAVYITNIEFVKDQFLASIHKALKKGGRLIIVDNNVTEPGVPPYYGPGISPELLIAQLRYYGFILKDTFEVIPQRFAMIFEAEEGYVSPEPRRFGAERSTDVKGSIHQVLRARRLGRKSFRPDGPDEGPEDDMRSDH